MVIGDPSRFNNAYSESYSGLRIEEFFVERVGKGTSIIYRGPRDGGKSQDFAEVTDPFSDTTSEMKLQWPIGITCQTHHPLFNAELHFRC